MNLFFRESGQGKPLIVLHGLFGSSDNWYTHAKSFSKHHKVYLVDQRNHGQSPHSDDFNYKVLTEDLENFIEQRGIIMPAIIGHSMGGKTAMNYAVKNPEKISSLIVVDIMPKSYPIHHDTILEGLEAVKVESIQSRPEADQQLAEYIPEPDVRQFLLKNLSRTSNGFQWKLNIAAIAKNIELIGAALQYTGTFNGPTLFINGSRSNYYKPGDERLVTQFFPKAKILTLDTGHWVPAEAPEAFAKTALDFLTTNSLAGS
jgi:pimeloyl-ACP methyl ester carboxylesterase